MIAGAARDRLSTARGAQVAHDVTVRIEDADLGYWRVRDALLSTSLTQ
jgi:hypothetical protein